MKNAAHFALGIIGSALLLTPAIVSASSLSLQSISPGTSISVSNRLSFTISTPDFTPNAYQISDSFAPSTISVIDITGAGNFSWVPVVSDVGTHTLSISATDSSGDTANTTETITVLPPPSVSVGSLSPATSVMPGTKLTFTVSTVGFTNPSYIVSDAFSGSSVTDANLDASGNFAWTPADIGQDGSHIFNVYVYDSLGHNASVYVPVKVGAAPRVTVQSLSPGTSLLPLQTLSFTINGSGFSPNAFSVSDNFPNTTITNGNTDASGAFNWVPQISDRGTHVLTITGIIGVFGQTASTTQTITVLGGAMPTPVASTTPPLATPTAGFTFTGSLYSGMQSDEVTKLQTILTQLGYFTGVPSGYFGPMTVTAVEQFQAAHGLPQIGVVGPATRTALNSGATATTMPTSTPSVTGSYTFSNFLGVGSTGDEVTALQQKLTTLKLYSGSVTGYFGPLTQAAVEAFQGQHSIKQVGYVGPGTRAVLNQ